MPTVDVFARVHEHGRGSWKPPPKGGSPGASPYTLSRAPTGVASAPMRVLSLIPSATEMVVALGKRDSLVGVTHSCDHPTDLDCAVVTSTAIPKGAASRHIDDVVKASLDNGHPLYHLDVNLVETLKPDVVLTQSVCEVCAVGEAQAMVGLDGLGISPDVVSLHPHRLTDVLDDLGRVGQAIGAASEAEVLLAEWRCRLRAVEEAARGLTPISVGVLEWTDPPFSAGHWTPDLVRAAGGVECFSAPGQRSRELSWEEIARADPAVLVMACCGFDVSRTLADLQALWAVPAFLDLQAVRSGEVYVADGGAHFSRPGPRLIEALELLAATLHPKSFPGASTLVRAPVPVT